MVFRTLRPISCRHLRKTSLFTSSSSQNRSFSTALADRQDAPSDRSLSKTRNIGIIAHIDAGKTTTTERMLYYSGFTRRIGDVDDGSTVTDFLPAERARGITIQSAAITFYWPPQHATGGPRLATETERPPCTINLIDTPGHADFTFEVIRSLRVLDGAVCVLDGVAGVEAQTEKVWHQASGYQIPRIVYVNKLDRDGASFHRTVKEVASKLHSSPVLCQIPWWKKGRFVGVGDVINCKAFSWEGSADGVDFKNVNLEDLRNADGDFAAELSKARMALIEGLTEHDDKLVEAFLDSNEDCEALNGDLVLESIRRILLAGGQKITPVYAGASFRNIGVQPLLDSINALLPAPPEAADPTVQMGEDRLSLAKLCSGLEGSTLNQPRSSQALKKIQDHSIKIKNVTSLALAFKVVNDARRGVLVYVRVYKGSIARNALLYNTNLSSSERANRLLRMYASDAVEISSIDEGQIGVIAGLKLARTGDTLLVYQGMNSKTGPPEPLGSLQLQPIAVPPPLFYTSIEPSSLSEQKNLEDAIAILLREDPSLSVSTDPESGQMHLAGMGELHLEIARDRLLNDFRVKARTGSIEIGYREVISDSAGPCSERFDKEVAGKRATAEVVASVSPREYEDNDDHSSDNSSHLLRLADENLLTIDHPFLQSNGKPRANAPPLPHDLTLRTIITAFQSGVSAALARGPSHSLPVHSTHTTIHLDQSTSISSSTTPAALVSAARLAAVTALRKATTLQPSGLLEPVMLATIAVTDATLGAVVHDLTSARGAQVLSLDADADNAESAGARAQLETKRFTPAQLDRVYAPPDPFGGSNGGSGGGGGAGLETDQVRHIKARVPLKEMVGYLKVLRSLTGGRGTFVMSVDRFERMGSQRAKVALAEMRGDFV